MKPTSLLVASLACNVALGAWLMLRPRDATSGHGTSAAATKTATPAVAPVHAGAAAGTTDLLALEPEALRDHLRTLALPADVIEHLVAARINAPLAARRRELLAEARRNQPPWKLSEARFQPVSILTPAQRKELRDLETAARAEIARLLGPAYLDRDGMLSFKYAFLPLAKAVQLDALDRDYDTLMDELRDETRVLKTPADHEREKILRSEQERDLAALLTPAERDAWEMRLSATARNTTFQQRIGAFQPTESEYRALFAIQKTHEGGLATAAPGGDATFSGAMIAGANMLLMNGGSHPADDKAVRDTLGDARFAEWQLAGQGHYQALVRLAAVENLEPGVVKQVSDLLTQTTTRSWEIAEDKSTTIDQKKSALAALSADARNQVTAHLGADRAKEYLTSTRWFDGIGTGTAVRITDRMIGLRSVDTPDRTTITTSSTTGAPSPDGSPTLTTTTRTSITLPMREPATLPTK